MRGGDRAGCNSGRSNYVMKFGHALAANRLAHRPVRDALSWREPYSVQVPGIARQFAVPTTTSMPEALSRDQLRDSFPTLHRTNVI